MMRLHLVKYGVSNIRIPMYTLTSHPITRSLTKQHTHHPNNLKIPEFEYEYMPVKRNSQYHRPSSL
jgi:hypothetical protein